MDTKVIPVGWYCYSKPDYVCPYHRIREDKPEQNNGECLFNGYKDWEMSSGFDLLWDGVKGCNINIYA